MLNFPYLKKCNISRFLKKTFARLLFQSIKCIPEEIFLIKSLHEEKVHRIIFHMAFIEWFYFYLLPNYTDFPWS